MYYNMAMPPVDIVALTSIIGGIIISLVSTIQNSKCTEVRCCGCHCIRDLTENKNNENKNENNKPIYTPLKTEE